MVRSLLDRLKTLEASVNRPLADTPDPPAAVKVEVEPSSQAAPLESLGFTSCDDGHGEYYRRVIRYDLLTVHGCKRFADIEETNLTSLFKAAKASGEPDVLRFYDTETTGLGTGAGHFAFLHAVGQVEGDEFALYQYVIRDYSEEPAVLRALLDHHFFQPNMAVVTFNGKSFDWPLFKTRLLMHRVHLGSDPAHVDLLYPCRRLWKQALERVSLGEVEKHVLGLTRVDDLPGKEAPNRYFAYISDGDEKLLEPVLDHNATDVCSLVSLAVVVAEILNGQRQVNSAPQYAALARWYEEWQEHELANRCLQLSTACADATWKEHWLLSLHHKRQARMDEAVMVWKGMVDQFPWTVQPAVELAKHAEHRLHAYDEAESWVRIAMNRVREGIRQRFGVHEPTSQDPVLEALLHRLKRIQAKAKARAETHGC